MLKLRKALLALKGILDNKYLYYGLKLLPVDVVISYLMSKIPLPKEGKALLTEKLKESIDQGWNLSSMIQDPELHKLVDYLLIITDVDSDDIQIEILNRFAEMQAGGKNAIQD